MFFTRVLFAQNQFLIPTALISNLDPSTRFHRIYLFVHPEEKSNNYNPSSMKADPPFQRAFPRVIMIKQRSSCISSRLCSRTNGHRKKRERKSVQGLESGRARVTLDTTVYRCTLPPLFFPPCILLSSAPSP